MSTENRIFRSYGRGCARSLVIQIVTAVMVIGGCAIVLVAAAFLPVEQDYKIIVWAVLMLGFLIVSVAGVFAWGLWGKRQRAASLDAAFLPLGLTGRGYLTIGRQYHGAYRSYPTHVYFDRGPALQIYLDVPLGTRLGIGRKSELARLASGMVSREVFDLDDPAFDHLAIYPDDLCWAADLFEDPQARAIILRLTAEETAAELRSLSITPNALLWQSRYLPLRAINPENVQSWVSDLYALARIAQGLTHPTVSAVESALEQSTRIDRGKYVGPVIGITCAVIGLMTACIIGISVLLIFLSESGM